MRLLPPPGPERRRQLTLLGGLVVVLAVYFWIQYQPAQTTGDGASSKSEEGAGAQARGKLVLPEPVKLTELDPAPENTPPGRNPFRYGQKPLPPAPPAPPVISQPTVYVPPPVTQQPPGPPPIMFEYNGTIVETGQKMLRGSITDPASGVTQMVVEGSHVDGMYKVVRLTAESITMSYLNGTGQRTIPVKR